MRTACQVALDQGDVWNVLTELGNEQEEVPYTLPGRPHLATREILRPFRFAELAKDASGGARRRGRPRAPHPQEACPLARPERLGSARPGHGGSRGPASLRSSSIFASRWSVSWRGDDRVLELVGLRLRRLELLLRLRLRVGKEPAGFLLDGSPVLRAVRVGCLGHVARVLVCFGLGLRRLACELLDLGPRPACPPAAGPRSPRDWPCRGFPSRPTSAASMIAFTFEPTV